MASDFIFMLTHSDRTIPDAHERVPDALRAGVCHIGFKDVGLPFASLRRLADAGLLGRRPYAPQLSFRDELDPIVEGLASSLASGLASSTVISHGQDHARQSEREISLTEGGALAQVTSLQLTALQDASEWIGESAL